MASAKTQAHRDGDLAIGPALPSQEDVGAGPLASNVALAAQGAQSYLCFFLCQEAGLSVLRFSDLLTD
jgi:hypothetical protein